MSLQQLQMFFLQPDLNTRMVYQISVIVVHQVSEFVNEVDA